MNTFGHLLRLTTFGESHGAATGGVIDGCPAGVNININELQSFVNLRRPGLTIGSTARKETDCIEILSGIYEGKSLGTPIGFLIKNNDTKSEDYTAISNAYRPNHADYTYEKKYGIRDPRGGGRASARETVARMVGGGIARAILAENEISVTAWTSAIGKIEFNALDTPNRSDVYSSPLRCPDVHIAEDMKSALLTAASEQNSLGGCVDVVVEGVPAGLGSPVFGKLQSHLAAAMFSIPAVKAFEYGDGFSACRSSGSEQQDTFIYTNGRVSTKSNHSGGIQGGITNGMPIRFKVGFKPIATLGRDMQTIDTAGNNIMLNPGGRHDVCAVPRAVAVVDAMTWLVVADAWLASRLDQH